MGRPWDQLPGTGHAGVLNFEITEGEMPAGIVYDRDPAFESVQFKDLLKQNDVKNLRCPRRTPLANAFVETLNGTLQRECTDHFLFFNEFSFKECLRNIRVITIKHGHTKALLNGYRTIEKQPNCR
jgi:hypothetical protein